MPVILILFMPIILILLLNLSVSLFKHRHHLSHLKKRKEKYFRGYQRIGSEVLLPCGVCTALMHEYITECVELESKDQPVLTFNQFCDQLYMDDRKRIQKIQGDYCSHLATKFDSNYDDESL